jgi:hypothetical protein
MAPLKLFGIIDINNFQNWLMNAPAKDLSGLNYSIVMTWYKCLLIFFSVLTINNIQKISALIPNNKTNNALFFATSPFFLFIVFIFSGYDIFSIYFTTLGFYFFLKKDLTKFSLAFSIAISCKFFALIIFIPLLLLREKNILQLIKYSFFGLTTCLIYFILYKNNQTFFENAFYVIKDKTGINHFSAYKYILLLTYSLICIFCYKFNSKINKDLIKTSIFIAYFSYCFIFIATPWHPNWLLITLPFSALIFSYIKKYKEFLIIEFLGFFSYIILMTNIWKDNLDQKMVAQGPLNFITGYGLNFRISDLFNVHLFDNYGIHLKGLLIALFYIYLFYPLYLYKNEISNLKVINSYIFRRYFYVLIFILPSALALIFKWSPIASENHDNIQNIYSQSIRCLYQMCK